MAARYCGRVFGWGLPVLILGTLLGAFSTALNGVQTLNGLFCFDTVRSESTVEESLVSAFVVSGYGQSQFYHSISVCNSLTEFLTVKKYPFCEQWTSIGDWNLTSTGFRCECRIAGEGVIESYGYTLKVNCTSGKPANQSFVISLTPGSSSMTGAGESTGYHTVADVNINRCALSQYFYFVFSCLCAAITMAVFIIRAWMRTWLVDLSFWLSGSETCCWAYTALERHGFFNFANPYRNEPYHLVKGEKFYVMRDRSSTGIGRDVGDTDSLACSSADTVYKFTYVDGEVFAYCKDRCGLETFAKKNVESSVASVIKEYLRQKSRSACVTNVAKSQILSLAECCELAQAGCELVEEISDGNYKMFYWDPRTQSRHSAQADTYPFRGDKPLSI